MKLYRLIVAASAIVLLASTIRLPAQAEEPIGSSGLMVTIAPYLWLASIDTTAKVPVPGGGTATTASTVTPWDYLPHLNFAAMLAGEARYDRFSVFTDFIYMNVTAQEIASNRSTREQHIFPWTGPSAPVSVRA